MKRNHFLLSSILIVLFSTTAFAQEKGQERLRFAFYNLENFFDTHIDSTRDYNAFTPEGEQRWTNHRYYKKRNDVYRVIMALGDWEAPSLVGFCEIENEEVLGDLIYGTPLKNANYNFVHYHSPDFRGIDAALIYRLDHLQLISSRPIPVRDPENPGFRTRDILYADFIVNEMDTVHVYINHWPSRFGGVLASIPRRMLAALTLRANIDSLMHVKPHAKVILMGDFNDTPEDDSIIKGLRAFPPDDLSPVDQLVHLFTNKSEVGHLGTIKYQHMWQIFDHIIVSRPLFEAAGGLRYKPESARIFTSDFLFTEDERYLGQKLFRTYVGPRYTGGISDHLPVFIDLEFVEAMDDNAEE
jgi:endonuclease/exonuclease/phosphatase family metal-dependent hydrolase